VAHTAKVVFLNDTVNGVVLYGIPANIETTSRPVLPNDFNITSDNSYLPAALTTQAYVFATSYPGASWSTSPIANPSFLNLTGYLGSFPDQIYHVERAWLRGETTLPIVFGMLTPDSSYTLVFSNAVTGAELSQTGVDSSSSGFVNTSYNSNTMPASITYELITNGGGGGGAISFFSLVQLGAALLAVAAVLAAIVILRNRRGHYP
jgi:hypothetical protein